MAWIFFLRLWTASALFIAALNYAPYLIFFVGFVLSYWFNRSGIFFTMSILLLCHLWKVNYFPAPGGVLDPIMIYNSVCFLVPVNILLFSLFKERGILTAGGRNRAVMILLQLIYIAAATTPGGEDIAGLFTWNIVSPGLLGATPITQPALLVFVIALVALMTGHLSGRVSMANHYAGVLITVFAALYYRNQHMAGPVFFSASGIMLLVAVIQDSYSKAYLDELTELPGRRALKEDLLKLDGSYAIAMLDIDFFKKFNDTYGHDVGDQVLKLVASIIKKVGGGGKAYRYGGEEFTILFPGKRMDGVVPHLEELRETIAKRAFTPRGKDRPSKKPDEVKPGRKSVKKLFITVSIGVSEKSKHHKTADEVVKAADASLYKAKKNGRNQVSC
ncbi:MAG: hypothetical protein VR69_08625 [Peptococcaceae bacterium BRH_c4b]|nr:MAG: hypothetical protein VR69_08625 [Peptococcaceae bacterium BRH_c4b]